MEELYPDHTEEGFLLHSERRTDGYVIMLTDLFQNNKVIAYHELSTWREYSEQYNTITMYLPGMREYLRSLLNDPDVRKWMNQRGR